MNIWDSVPGQESLKNRLAGMAESDQVSHAYIIEGTPSAVRNLLARGFTQKLLCEKGTGCGSCRTCRQIEAGSHLDVISVTHEKPNIISVDEIRHQLVDDMDIRPYQSRYKIYLVDEADKMNPEAQNALLKTLEEPPSYGMILLLADNSDVLLPTILSRAVLLRMQNAEEDTMTQEDREEVFSVIEHLWELDSTNISQAAAKWKEKAIDSSQVCSCLRTWFRDILLWKSVHSVRSLNLKYKQPAIQEFAEHYSFRQIQESLKAVEKAENRLFLNVNETLVMDALLLEMMPKVSNKALTALEFDDYLIPNEEEKQFYGD